MNELEKQLGYFVIIFNESEKLSGKIPVYELFDEELRLKIFAAKPA